MKPRTLSAFSLLLLCLPHTMAATALYASDNDQHAIKLHEQTGFTQLQHTADTTETPKPSEKRTHTIDNAFLTQHPELFHAAMQEAINSGHSVLLADLSAAYRTLPQADGQTLRRAEAALARSSGDYRQAVSAHLNLARDFPDDRRIALDTAAVLFEDKQWREASARFDRLHDDTALPPEVRHNIAHYRNRINEARRWQLEGGISVARHHNINQAAPSYCTPIGCTRERAENALGLNYRLKIGKNTPLGGHHNLSAHTHISGTSYYPDKQSQHDHAFGRSYLGWQYQNARSSLSVLPFYQFQLAGRAEFDDNAPKQRRLGLDMLAHAAGVQISAAHQFNARTGGYVSAEYHRSRYRPQEQAERHNGGHTHLSAGAAYRPDTRHTFSLHIGRQQFAPANAWLDGQRNNAAYTRLSAGLGWQAHWPQLGGLHSHIQTAFAQRRHRGEALNEHFRRQPQRNLEHSFSAALAHDKISWRQFTPKLVWQQNRTRSSHAWAARRQQQWFVELNRRF